jgi:hypothetical protein
LAGNSHVTYNFSEDAISLRQAVSWSTRYLNFVKRGNATTRRRRIAITVKKLSVRFKASTRSAHGVFPHWPRSSLFYWVVGHYIWIKSQITRFASFPWSAPPFASSRFCKPMRQLSSCKSGAKERNKCNKGCMEEIRNQPQPH